MILDPATPGPSSSGTSNAAAGPSRHAFDIGSIRSSSPVSSILPDYHDSQLSRPPRYTRHTRPSIPLTYTFSSWATTNSMILSPPIEETSTPSPSYRISATLNLDPLLPVSYVTRVDMLALDGEEYFVGEFELSLYQKRGVLSMGDICTRLANVIESIDQSRKHFKWRMGPVDIRWDCRTMLDDGSPMCVCYGSDASKSQLATFVPPPILATPPPPPAAFTVFPDGHEFFEHILLSILVIQRILTRND